MKDRKQRMEFFSFYDRTAMERHLEAMAAKGWLLEKMGFLWTYRRTEPKKLRFSVGYYPNATGLEPETPEGQLAYQELCGHTGWVLAAFSGQMQVFYNEQENPTPIETDPALEVETFHRAAKKTYLPYYFVMLGISLLQVCFFGLQLIDAPIYHLCSTTWLFGLESWTIIFLMTAADLCGYSIWRHKAREAAENGEFLETKGCGWFQKLCLGLIAVSFLWWMTSLRASTAIWAALLALIPCTAAIIWTVTALKKRMKRAKVSARKSGVILAVTFFALAMAMAVGLSYAASQMQYLGVFEDDVEFYTVEDSPFPGDNTYRAFHDVLPLTVKDFLGGTDEGYSLKREVEESPLLRVEVMRQNMRLDRLKDEKEYYNMDYVIYSPKFQWVYDACKRESLGHLDGIDPDLVRFRYVSIDPAPWGAVKAYESRLPEEYEGSHNWPYLLCYEDRIVKISFDWEPTAEHRALVGEKLGK